MIQIALITSSNKIELQKCAINYITNMFYLLLKNKIILYLPIM